MAKWAWPRLESHGMPWHQPRQVAEKGGERGPQNVATTDQGGRLGAHDRVPWEPGGSGRVAECSGRGVHTRGKRAHHRDTMGCGTQNVRTTQPHCAQRLQTG
ncbi:hypothetical protein PanWU01x14_021610 [Parasponia andersonii]|uniref:Uncharacterized protein n=1 Tax=Parasponia andersonii TaxID=3476 RepID=A0A2P5DY24_PARAD|nr:hypothetical protein PanWU01x14_021610 [Parasponia andersonii]